MVHIQTYFNQFNNIIRTDYDDNSVLRDKRDLLLENLNNSLQIYSRDYHVQIPKNIIFNQGSYVMGTGIKPLPGEDYDIDVGLCFHLSRNDYSPIQVKQWVYDALRFGSRTVEYKRPCVRVQYHQDGEDAYHVDFAVYSGLTHNWDNQSYLAKGLPGSQPQFQIWEISNPNGLIEIFRQKFSNQQGHRNQFRRVIRLLKRLAHYNFSADGNTRPAGIALTACAMKWFQASTAYGFHGSGLYYDDLNALKNLAESVLNQFNRTTRMSAKLPVPPYNDLFAKMSDKQMQTFKFKLVHLISALKETENTLSPFNTRKTPLACRKLQDVFGNDFPSPERERV